MSVRFFLGSSCVLRTFLCALPGPADLISRYTHLPTPAVGDRGKWKASGYSASLLGITELSSPFIPMLPSILVHTVKGLVLWLCHTRVSSRAKVWQVRVTGSVPAVEGNPVPPVSFKVLWSPVTGHIPNLRSRVSGAETQESGLPQPLGLGEGQKSSSSIQSCGYFHLWYASISMPPKCDNASLGLIPIKCLEQPVALPLSY